MKATYLYLAAVSLLGWGCTDSPTMIEGTLEGIEADSVFLYEVVNEHYGSLKYKEAIPVTEGKFSISADSLAPQLYALSTESERTSGYVQTFAKAFLAPSQTDIVLSRDPYGQLQIHASGPALTEGYQAFMDGLADVENRAVLDSLDYLFYQARGKGDTATMAQIKETSAPYYEQAGLAKREYLRQTFLKQDTTALGLYLFYSYRFQNHTFNTREEIADIRRQLKTYGADARQSPYYTRIMETLEQLERCAVGSLAPEIEGVAPDGQPVKLSDFKGKYVLVDFWSSGCHWCRLETPNLQKAYQTFKNKGFTILGVSSDFRKQDWLKAIEEDKSHWDQLLLPKEKVREVMAAYCIVGIPHIILINPKGMIIAKDLRGEAIFSTVKEAVGGSY